jgi:predicted PurR-regulated permease PerM
MTASTHRRATARNTAYLIWAIIGGIILAGAALWGLFRISGALAPFVIAFIVVLLLQGPVRSMEERGLKRIWAVAITFAIGFVALTVALLFLVPAIADQIVEFTKSVPGYIESGRAFFLERMHWYEGLDIPAWVGTAAASLTDSIGQILGNLGKVVAERVVSAGGGIGTVVFNMLLGTVVAFWILKDLPKMRDELRRLAGEKYEADLENILSTVGRGAGGYIKGQTIASLVTGVIAAIGLAVIGVPYAVVLGILTFVSNYVPYVGPVFAGIVAAISGVVVGWPQALGAIVVVIAAQQLTDIFVTPRVMAENVDLHPTLVIFSLLVGGSLFGFWGMIFAIPVAATAKSLFVYYREARTNRSLATEDGAFFRAQADDDARCGATDDDERVPDDGASGPGTGEGASE